MPLVWNESLLNLDKSTMTTPKIPSIKWGGGRPLGGTNLALRWWLPWFPL